MVIHIVWSLRGIANSQIEWLTLVPKESENSSKTTDLTLHTHNISKLKR